MIVTVARDEGLRLRIAAALRDSPWASPVTALSSVDEVDEFIASAAVPSVFIVGPEIGLDGAVDIASAAANLRAPTPVLLIADPTTEVLRAAMRAGIRDVLPPDFEVTDLVGAFEDAKVRSSGPPSIPGLTVAVFSTKGGVGTSVVASNLAVRLGVRTARPVTLLDLDLASADQAIMHGMSPRWTVQDAAAGSVGLDGESLHQVLLEVPGTRTRLLPGPIDPALAETITAGDVSSVIAAARSEAPIAVLDTSSSFDDRTLAALDVADAVVVVSSLDVAALRALTVSLQTLEQLGVDRDRVDVAVVRADSKSGLTISDVERAIDRDVDVGVPSTRAVPRSINEGVPLAVSAPRSGVVGAIDELVGRVLRHAAADFEVGAGEEDGGDGLLGGLFPWSRSKGSADDGADPTTGGPSASATVEQEPFARGGAGDESTTAASRPGDKQEGAAPGVRRRRRRLADPPSPGDGQKGTDAQVLPLPDRSIGDDSPVGAMPPPIVVEDDEQDNDDRPRRRRGR